jgi:hypothetical protein
MMSRIQAEEDLRALNLSAAQEGYGMKEGPRGRYIDQLERTVAGKREQIEKATPAAFAQLGIKMVLHPVKEPARA